MKFKGISEVIATLLMLIITIALAGTAYLYISGYFRSTTSRPVIDVSSSYCYPDRIVVAVKNPGMDDVYNIQVTVYDPSGTNIGSGTINLIKAGMTNTTTISRGTHTDPGYYRITISGSQPESIWCPQGS